MIVPIKTLPGNFVSTYISILNPILKLRNREADILEAFLKVYYANKNNPRVNQLLFSHSALRSIKESLGMTTASFNNHKFRLRKKEILIGRSINPLITKNLPKDGKLNITFALEITKNKNNGQEADSKKYKNTTVQQ